MIELSLYALLAVFFLGFPLYLYKHPLWIVLTSSATEMLCIFLIYGSTFLMCTDGQHCGGNWTWIIPTLIAAMNIGIVWPVLAGYAKQAALDQKQAGKSQDKAEAE